jgi:hypothetical protein
MLGIIVLAAAGVLAAVSGVYVASRQTHTATFVAPAPRSSSDAPGATPAPTSPPAPPTPVVPSYAMNGPGTYVYAAGSSPVAGTGGTPRTYRVAVETGIPVPVADFAALVDRTLADPRSWIGGGNVRLQRVPGGTTGVNFTVLLVTPGTAENLCGAVGLDIVWHGEPYSSCQSGQRAVINLSRYLKAVPDYGAPVASYDQYAVNHEVGHVLGYDHELCPGKGMPAPVMQQQTFDLQGCVANSWPYIDDKLYSGPPGRIVPSD